MKVISFAHVKSNDGTMGTLRARDDPCAQLNVIRHALDGVKHKGVWKCVFCRQVLTPQESVHFLRVNSGQAFMVHYRGKHGFKEKEASMPLCESAHSTQCPH